MRIRERRAPSERGSQKIKLKNMFLFEHAAAVVRYHVIIFLASRMVCLACFSWKLVGIMTTATAVAILEVALAVSARACPACACVFFW